MVGQDSSIKYISLGLDQNNQKHPNLKRSMKYKEDNLKLSLVSRKRRNIR